MCSRNDQIQSPQRNFQIQHEEDKRNYRGIINIIKEQNTSIDKSSNLDETEIFSC